MEMSKILWISCLTSPAILAMQLLVSTSAVVARNVSDLDSSPKSILPKSQVPVQIACGNFQSLNIFSEDMVNSSLAQPPAATQTETLNLLTSREDFTDVPKKHTHQDTNNLFQTRNGRPNLITNFSMRDLLRERLERPCAAPRQLLK